VKTQKPNTREFAIERNACLPLKINGISFLGFDKKNYPGRKITLVDSDALE